MSNLYFFNLFKGMYVDFSATFHIVLVLEFTYVFLRAFTTQQGEFMAKEPRLYL
jgi:hypothetical protein